ncbi:MAG: Uxx-star family glutaredoxin-like (seleno)protein [Dehalococcoidia bacterium]|nr:Uxx-star family glutaredoxin-like (seleno)protein [Dehalococcoidia bacterium]
MRVEIYTTPACGYCHQAKKFFQERGVAYTEYDVSRDREAARKLVQLTRQTGVPVIVAGNEVIIGFNLPRLEQLLVVPGYEPRARLGLRVANASRYSQQQGAYVGEVEGGSSAERAGLRQGDVIVSIDSNHISGASDLERVIASFRAGTRAVVVFIRGERSMQTQVAL